MKKDKPLLIVGLGNPGTRYEHTRHNVGFMAVDKLANSKEQRANWKQEKDALIYKSEISNQKSAIFAKPQTFMNLSGKSVQALMTFYKIPPENIIVIHDDIDLKLGDVRTKTGGGDAGHNGLKSITAAIGNNYKRIRIGIGRPPRHCEESQSDDKAIFSIRHLFQKIAAPQAARNDRLPVADYVLQKFTADEMRVVKEAIDKILLTNDSLVI